MYFLCVTDMDHIQCSTEGKMLQMVSNHVNPGQLRLLIPKLFLTDMDYLVIRLSLLRCEPCVKWSALIIILLVPTFRGKLDALTERKSIFEEIRKPFPCRPVGAFNHPDFMWGRDASSLLYHDIVRLIRKHSRNR